MEYVFCLHRCGSVNLDPIYLYTFAVPDCLTKSSQ